MVPVLSAQITVVEPSVSTAASRRTSAPRRASRQSPAASASDTTAGRPSGTAATARLTAVSSISPTGSPCRMPARPTTAQIPTASTISRRPSASTWRSSGVVREPAEATSRPIRPSSVAGPVAVTSATPLPDRIVVPR